MVKRREQESQSGGWQYGGRAKDHMKSHGKNAGRVAPSVGRQPKTSSCIGF